MESGVRGGVGSVRCCGVACGWGQGVAIGVRSSGGWVMNVRVCSGGVGVVIGQGLKW